MGKKLFISLIIRIVVLLAIPLTVLYVLNDNEGEMDLKIVKVTTVTDATFQYEVVEAKVPVIVVYKADWCGACQFYTPMIEQASMKYADVVKFVTVDVDKNAKVSDHIGLLPTTEVYQKGSVTASHSGAILDTDRLNRFIDEAIKE